MTISYVLRSKDDRAYYAGLAREVYCHNYSKMLDLISAINLACYKRMAMILLMGLG